MDVDLMFPSLYLKAEDLKGQDKTLTIRRVLRQEIVGVNGAKENKWIMYFEETYQAAQKTGRDEKRYIFCRKFGKQVAAVTGVRDGEQWVGHKITIYPTVENGRDCIRVRPTTAAQTEET